MAKSVLSAIAAASRKAATLSGVDSNRGWSRIFSSGDFNTGYWQQDTELSRDTILSNGHIWSSVTQIAGDIAKLAARLMTMDQGVWVETTNAAFSPVLRKPNHYQTRQQFIESWMLSKLIHGNAYVLKARDNRGGEGNGNVRAMYVLDPTRVMPLVATSGEVFYQLQRDDLSKLPQGEYPAIPASEIIHDRANCFFHTLVGLSPLFAAQLPASQGLRMQKNSEKFFQNMSRPGGMLTAPGEIGDDTAKRLKEEFEKNFSGDKIGRLFVGGDGLKFDAMAVPAEQSQMVEQLKLSGEQIAGIFGVPAFLIGAGPVPSYDNVQSLMQLYHSACLQEYLTAIEDLLDDGMGLTAKSYRVEFDLDDLLRMDSKMQAEVEAILVQRGIRAPNASRRRFGEKPVEGGDVPFMQEQNWPINVLAKRETPLNTPKLPPAPPPADDEPSDEEARAVLDYFEKAFA